jgi:hypothetical protein
MKLMGIISVGFDVTVQLIFRSFAIVGYWRKTWEYNETVYQLFVDFKKAYDSVRREVLYNILIEFGVPMKLVRLIKMCLNDTTASQNIDISSWDTLYMHWHTHTHPHTTLHTIINYTEVLLLLPTQVVNLHTISTDSRTQYVYPPHKPVGHVADPCQQQYTYPHSKLQKDT